MKKKLLATVGALALAAAMATSTFAAGFVGSAVGSNKPSAGDVTSSKGYLAEVKDVAADVVTELQGYGSAADMLQKNSINTSTLPAAVQNELSTMSFLTAFDLNAAGSDTFTVRQDAGDYEIPVDVNYSRQGLPLQWPVKAWVTATLAGEEVLNLPLDTDFIQPGSENSPSDPSGCVTFYLRFSREKETWKLPWKAEYEGERYPRLDYQLHILDNGDVESTYSLNP